MVGNGQFVQVQGTGNGTISLPNYKLSLKNILHAPKISHNLLSVFRIALDNQCRLIFDSNGYTIHDIKTKRIIHMGGCHQGMYLLNPYSEGQNGDKL